MIRINNFPTRGALSLHLKIFAMKKLIFCALAAIILIPLTGAAQRRQVTITPIAPVVEEPFAQPPHTEANHSISLGYLWLRYAYEHPISRTSTIIGRAGADFGAAWGNGFFGNYSYWVAAPVIEVEPRWYYGLDRRAAHGRSTEGNAGSFLSLNLQTMLPGYVSDRSMEMSGVTALSPTWGFRRVWGSGWMFEFRTGLVFLYLHRGMNYLGFSPFDGLYVGTDRHLFWAPQLNFRFGYSF